MINHLESYAGHQQGLNRRSVMRPWPSRGAGGTDLSCPEPPTTKYQIHRRHGHECFCCRQERLRPRVGLGAGGDSQEGQQLRAHRPARAPG